ncbi:MAG: hypothetical protein R3F33_11720 [Planctomycetota bacterium]
MRFGWLGINLLGGILVLAFGAHSYRLARQGRAEVQHRLERRIEQCVPRTSAEIVYPAMGVTALGQPFEDRGEWETYFSEIVGGGGELWEGPPFELDAFYEQLLSGEGEGRAYPELRRDVLLLREAGVTKEMFLADVERVFQGPELLVAPSDSVRAYLRAVESSAKGHLERALEVGARERFDFRRRTVQGALDGKAGCIPGQLRLPTIPSTRVLAILRACMRARCVEGDVAQATVLLKGAYAHLSAYRGSHSFLGATLYSMLGCEWMRMVEDWLYCFSKDADAGTLAWIEHSVRNLDLGEELESAMIGQRARALEFHCAVEEAISAGQLREDQLPISLSTPIEFQMDRLLMLDCIEECLRRIRSGEGFELQDCTGYQDAEDGAYGRLGSLGQVVLGELPMMLHGFALLSELQRMALAGLQSAAVGSEEALAADAERPTLFAFGRLRVVQADDGSRRLHMEPDPPGAGMGRSSEPWRMGPGVR